MPNFDRSKHTQLNCWNCLFFIYFKRRGVSMKTVDTSQTLEGYTSKKISQLPELSSSLIG